LKISLTKIFVALIVLLTISAASIAAASAKPAPNKVLIFGDSLSAAYGLRPEQGWPAIAATELAKKGITLINASVSGETSAGGLSRLPEILKRHRPNVLVLALGANDGLRGLDPSAMQRNLVAMTKLAQASKARVLIVGIRLPPNFGPEYNQMFEQSFVNVSAMQKTALLKFLLEPIAGDIGAFQADQLHPTAGAQPKIWAHVRAALLPLIK
jgi:acyl-CoA thioesterase-1